MSKAWKITLIIISSILALLLAFVSVYFLWPWNKGFFDAANKEFAIPGLDTTFVPQGMTQIDGSDKYIISGYMSDKSPSRFYVIEKDGQIDRYFTLKSAEEDYTGHAAGIVSKGSTIWIVGDKVCYRTTLSAVNKVANAGVVEVLDSFETLNGADFAFEHNNYLWIGEFYKKDKYETHQSHRLETRSGETNPSLVFGYKIDESVANGLYSTTPTKALSIVGECQGMAVSSSGKFVLSTSWSIKDSTMYYYKDVLSEEKHDTFYMGNKVLDLWYLDGKSLISTQKIPSMSENVLVMNDRAYILFESAAKKYKLVNRKQLSNVYSVPLSYFEK